MLRSEAITIIKRGLGFRQTQDAAIVAALQEAQRDLEKGKTLPKWLLTEGVCAVTLGSYGITLPADFIRMDDDMGAYYYNAQGALVFLAVLNTKEALEAFVGDKTSAELGVAGTFPQAFALQSKTTAIIVPYPTAPMNPVRISYYKSAAVLSSDIENEWLKNAPNLLVGLAGAIVAGDLRDKDALARFTARANEGQRAFLGDVIEDELSGRGLIMGRNN